MILAIADSSSKLRPEGVRYNESWLYKLWRLLICVHRFSFSWS